MYYRLYAIKNEKGVNYDVKGFPSIRKAALWAKTNLDKNQFPVWALTRHTTSKAPYDAILIGATGQDNPWIITSTQLPYPKCPLQDREAGEAFWKRHNRFKNVAYASQQ